MVLQYNGVDLATLGTLRILAHTTQREPAEAPQRERVTYRIRLDFFEQSFPDNFTLIQQLRAALKAQNAQLVWQDANGVSYLERTATAAEDESTDEALTRGGTYWQAITFTFWFYNHDVVTNCLSMTFRRDGGQLLTFTTVEKWQQRFNITRFDELRSQKKLVTGSISCSGRIQGDTTSDLATRQAALQALKDTLLSEMAAAEQGELVFGTFDREVRPTEFRADVDQPNNYIAWSMTATFTVFPDESDYATIEVRIQNRENLAEGIPYFTLSGKIGAPTAVLANARLTALLASLTPDGYVTLARDISQPYVQTESGAEEGVDQGDGAVFTEIQFTVELRDPSSITCTYQRTVANAPLVNLGTVDKFRNGFNSQLFDDMRDLRKRVGGTLSLSGKWYAADSLSAADKQAQLLAQLATMETELENGFSGTLVYTTLIDQVVRVVDFNADINRLNNCIEWSLTATFTRFPDESSYAVCEIKVGTRQDRLDGVVIKTLTGRIGAPSATLAQSKLAKLRQTFVPNTFVLKTDSNEQNQVSVQSDGDPSTSTNETAAFIELTINEEWQQQSGNVLSYKLRRNDLVDNKTQWVRTTFSGTVTASSLTDQPTAFNTALAQAALLGDGKYPYQVQTSVIQISNQVLTTGAILVVVEFNYEYLRKGSLIYTEVNSELSEDTFGNNVLSVSGYITAATLALMQTTYQNDVRNVATYTGDLLLNERTTQLSQQRLDNTLTNLSALDDRFVFSFQILLPKDGTQTAITYSLETQSNLQTLEKTTTVSGVLQAADEATAEAFLDSIMAGLGLGKRLSFSRTPHYQQGPQVTGGVGPAAPVLTSWNFTEVWVDMLVGVVSGILMSECSADILYSGNRVVEKPIPDGPSILQIVGQTAARRVVTARAIGTTESSCDAWVRTIRLALMSTTLTYEEAPQITTGFKFLPQTAGVPEGESNNTLLYEVTAKFSERIASLPFVP